MNQARAIRVLNFIPNEEEESGQSVSVQPRIADLPVWTVFRGMSRGTEYTYIKLNNDDRGGITLFLIELQREHTTDSEDERVVRICSDVSITIR